MATIAILITCYNRVQTTLQCLKCLFACDRPDGLMVDVWLVDDNSPDHTGEVIQETYPGVHVIFGSGSLYWCGGMRLAWKTAAEHNDYDAFLWLNDDTFLFADALSILLRDVNNNVANKGDIGIIVGAVCDSETGKTTYGFTGDPPRSPNGTLSPIQNETINGNVVWVSRKTWQSIGGLRDCFTHSMGDTDYGIRALKKKIPIWLTEKHIGVCYANKGKRWNENTQSLGTRWKMLHSPKGCPPREFLQLVKVAHPLSWPKYMLKLYWSVLLPKTPLDYR